MDRLSKLAEILLTPAIIIASLAISLLDFSGLLGSSSWMSQHLPSITLVLLALTLSSVSILQGKHGALHRDVQFVLSDVEFARMRRSLEQLDPNLRKVFGDDFTDLMISFKLAIEAKKIAVNSGSRYRYFYIRTLQCYPKASFLATSFPRATYLWKDLAVEEAVKAFIRNGGKMTRIFFIRDAHELTSSEVQEVLTRQCKIGVKVYTVYANTVAYDLQKNFLVEAKGRIAWETFMHDNQKLGSCIATADTTETQKYCQIIKRLQESNIQEYVPLEP